MALLVSPLLVLAMDVPIIRQLKLRVPGREGRKLGGDGGVFEDCGRSRGVGEGAETCINVR